MSGGVAVCTACPRACGVRRDADTHGLCGVPDTFRVARIAPHHWEEPPISGTRGSGTVFFSGCSLRCVFCQNRAISRGGRGEDMSDAQLTQRILALQDEGVHNINLVTPTHYAPRLRVLLEGIKPHLRVPVVYNCGGYESLEALRALEGLVDIYLPDFKYISRELSAQYSGAADYAEVARAAIAEMHRQVGAFRTDADGMLRRGMIVRHLVLPGCRHDSMDVLRTLAAMLPVTDIRLSLMAQYTPDFAHDCPYPNLHRRVTTFEYTSVLRLAEQLGFDGYMQSPTAATAAYTPDF